MKALPKPSTHHSHQELFPRLNYEMEKNGDTPTRTHTIARLSLVCTGCFILALDGARSSIESNTEFTGATFNETLTLGLLEQPAAEAAVTHTAMAEQIEPRQHQVRKALA